jgi:hypothetical protein
VWRSTPGTGRARRSPGERMPRPTCIWGRITDRGYDRAESVLSAGKDCSRETLTPNERGGGFS